MPIAPQHLGSFSGGNLVPTGITTDKLPDWHEVVHMQFPEATPLIALLTMFEESDAKSQHLYWQEHDFISMDDTTNDAALTAVLTATVMTVSNVTRWKPGFMAMNLRTTERVVVTSVDYANSTVYLGHRNVGTALGAALGINDGDTWLLLQNGREELSSAIPCATRSPVIYNNVCQFMSDTMEMSWIELGRAAEASLNKTKDWDVQTQIKINEFKLRTELSLFFSHMDSLYTGSPGSYTNVRRFTGGLDWWTRNSPTSQSFAGGILTWPEFRRYLAGYRSANMVTSADLLMRPELHAEVIRMFGDGAKTDLSQLPSGLNYQVNEFQFGPCKYRIHPCQSLKIANDHSIWILDTSGKKKADRGIKVKYCQVGGGTEHRNGRIGWINDQQEPSYSAKKSQLALVF